MFNWRGIIFSEESWFEPSLDDQCIRVWTWPGHCQDPAFTVAHHTSHQREVMMWGAISYDSWTYLVAIRDIVVTHSYADFILRPVLLPLYRNTLGLFFNKIIPGHTQYASPWIVSVLVTHFAGHPNCQTALQLSMFRA